MQFEHHNQIQNLIQKRTAILQKLNDLSLENHEDITSFLTFLNSNLVDFDAYDLITFYLLKHEDIVQFSSKIKSIKRVEKTYKQLHIFDREIAYFDKHFFIYHESLNTSEVLKDQMGVLFEHTCSNQALDIPIFKMDYIIGIIRFEASIKPFTDTFIWFISSLFEHYRNHQFNQLLDINNQTNFVNKMFRQALIEKNKVAFFTYDIDQKTTHFEKGSYQLFGLDDDLQLTKDFMISHIHPDDIHKVTLSTLDTIQSKKSNTIVYRIKINQTDHWFLSYQIYTTMKQKAYLIGFIEDISNPLAKVEHFMDYQSYTDTLSMMRIKELEKEVQSNQLLLESKNKFISNMSHEIRTPMNSIMGFTELMKTLNLKDEEKEYVDRIHDASKHLLSIVNDILDLSKLEAGKIVIEKIPFQLTSLLNSVKVIFEDILKQKKLYLDIETIHCPNYIVGDENRIRQILINLISNAIKFTETGGISLVVSAKELLDTNQFLFEFKVKDTGIGMSPLQLNKLFQDFSQADISTSRLYGGTGLGLSISKRLALLMEGDLTVTSSLNDGSEFMLKIPLTIQSETLEQDEKPVSQMTPKAGSHILLVDDNPLNVRLMERLLLNLSMVVTTAENGSIALDLARNHTYDLIFLDIQMPIMDGIETTKNIRLFNQKTPIIAMTGDAMTEIKQLALSVGMNDYLIKPIDNESLYKALSRFIPDHQKK